jgi:energy-coupling factor transporter transmembrane protein EcfT
MKDSFTLSAVGWYTYSFYHFFIKKERKLSFAVYLFVASFIILAIKPYIFFALLPGSILWLSNNLVKKIKHSFIRMIASPLLLSIAGLLCYVALNQMGESLGAYKLDTVLDKAVVTQQDMKAEHYGGKSFDIGDFDASAGGIASKAPSAIFAGIFRPGIWDVRNPVMLISALENSYLLILTIFLLIKLKVRGFFKFLTQNSLILFSMLFSLFFAFSVGLTVANFGSLVRLRIPELPFFVASLFAIKHQYDVNFNTKSKAFKKAKKTSI